jgi:FkbM family methyltransferase
MFAFIKNRIASDVRSRMRYELAKRGLQGIPSHTGSIDLHELTGLLPSQPVILEAGAHDGTDTFRLAVAFPKASIHAFEPVPPLYERLCRRFRRIPNVNCYPYALSDHAGQTNLVISGGVNDASSSILQPQQITSFHPEITFSTAIAIDCTTIDIWARSHRLNRIDLMWLDMQGAELSALKAATSILPTVSVIHTEVFLKELYRGAPLYNEVREWLEERGFCVSKEYLMWEDSGNVLFVRDNAGAGN